jgi:iron complex outermembrane receptor protein
LEAILKHSLTHLPVRLALLALSLAAALFCSGLSAQQAASKLEGALADVQGKAVANALVTVKNESTGVTRTVYANGDGAYSIDGLTAGKYIVKANATGFAESSKEIEITAGQNQQLALTLPLSSVAEQVTVNAGIDSIAAQTAPSGGFIEERSAQSLVSNTYIENFTSPIADYG